MRIKLDENIPVGLVTALADLGHDVDSIPQEGLNGCFPRTEEAVEPYRGEERRQTQSEPGGTLSWKPLDDRLGEDAMLNAAICTAFGARRGSPTRDCLGQG
jgi:hypothetical protein